MSDVQFFKGGTPTTRLLWCEGDVQEFEPPFQVSNMAETPPYDSHFDGAYGLGYFTGGMPIRPSIMKYQRDALRKAKPKVGDIIQCIVIPVDHYATYMNIKISETDKNLAGATVAPTAQVMKRTADGNYEIKELSDIDEALKVQGITEPIKLDIPSSTFVSLVRVYSTAKLPIEGTANTGSGTITGSADTGTGTISGSASTNTGTITGSANTGTGTITGSADTGTGVITGSAQGPIVGYAQPLYSEPDEVIILGLRIVSLPTEKTITLDMANNGWYVSVKVEGFECPTQL